MKRLVVLAVAAAAASIVVAVLASSGSASHPGSRTFVLIEDERKGSFNVVDNRPRSRNGRNPSVSAGDLLMFSTPLLNQANARVGTLEALCTATRSGRTFERASFHCNGTFRLRDGSLALSATFRGSDDTPLIAVVGGTGAYEGARGSVTSRNLPRERIEDTVHISQ
jgi:Dirigent-like protein